MHRRFFLVVAPLALLYLSGCGAGEGLPAPNLPLNTDTTLTLGRSVQVLGQPDILLLDSVLEDSRCPVNAACVSAGRIRVRVRIVTPRGSFTQEASLPPPEVELAVVPPSGYTVQLIEATPLPFIGQTIRPGDYRLTIRVHKLV